MGFVKSVNLFTFQRLVSEIEHENPDLFKQFEALSDKDKKFFVLNHIRRETKDRWNLRCEAKALPHFKLLDAFDERMTIEKEKITEKMIAAFDALGIPTIIFDNQIDAVLDVMEGLRKGEKVISIEAVTQSGKTGILNLASLAWHLYCYGNQTKVVPFNIFPVKISISTQSESAFHMIIEMFYAFEFVGSIPNRKLIDVYADENGEFIFDKYTKSLGVNAFGKLCEAVDGAIADGFAPIFFFDESDEAPHSHGFLGRVLRKYKDQGTFVLLSATAYPFKIENVFTITAKTGPGYRGLFDEPGHKIVPIISFDELDRVCGMHEFADWEDIKKGYDLRKVRALINLIKRGTKGLTAEEIGKMNASNNAGLYPGAFNGGAGCAVRFSNGKDACDRFASDLEAEIRKGQLPKCRVLKFYGSALTQQTVMIGNRSIHLTYSTIEEMVQVAQKAGIERFIIVIASSLRRGDCVPKNIRWFIDGAREMSTSTSIIQGFAGRATGYGSESVLFLTQANCEEIDAHRMQHRLTNCKVGNVNPGSHSRRIHASEANGITRTKVVSKSKPKQEYIRRETYEAEFPEVFAAIDRVIGQQIEWVQQDMKRDKGTDTEHTVEAWTPKLTKNRGKNGINESPFHRLGFKNGRVDKVTGERSQTSVDFWKLFGGLLPEKFLARIEADRAVQIMRPGQQREEVKRNGEKVLKRLNDEGGFTHISIGNYERQREHGESRRGDTGDRALRDPSVRTTDKDNASLNIDMLFSSMDVDGPFTHVLAYRAHHNIVDQKVMLITVPLCDDTSYAAFSQSNPSGAIVSEVILSMAGSASYDFLMSERERGMMTDAAPARGSKKRNTRPRKPSKAPQIPIHRRGNWGDDATNARLKMGDSN